MTPETMHVFQDFYLHTVTGKLWTFLLHVVWIMFLREEIDLYSSHRMAVAVTAFCIDVFIGLVIVMYYYTPLMMVNFARVTRARSIQLSVVFNLFNLIFLFMLSPTADIELTVVVWAAQFLMMVSWAVVIFSPPDSFLVSWCTSWTAAHVLFSVIFVVGVPAVAWLVFGATSLANLFIYETSTLGFWSFIVKTYTWKLWRQMRVKYTGHMYRDVELFWAAMYAFYVIEVRLAEFFLRSDTRLATCASATIVWGGTAVAIVVFAVGW